MSLARSGDRNGSNAITRMCKPCARLATIEPILPQPTTPSTLPVISTPMKRFFSHRIAERRVHHDDALGGGRGNFHIVDADAGAADHFEPGRLLDDLGGGLGRGTDSEPIVIADDLRKLVLVLAEIGLEIDIDAAILEYLDGGRRQRIGNQYFGLAHLGSA